ncbi:MAG: aromatic amino acid transport family protein [bacterium]
MFHKKLFYPFSIFTGTIIGVGLFTLPYVTLKAGIITILSYFILVGLLVIFIHLLFGEVVLRTDGIHRLPGYVHIYLGKNSRRAVLFSTLLGLYGSLLAYIIIGGEFLWGLANPILGGEKFIYILTFFIFGTALIWHGTKSIAKIEFWFLALFFVLLLFLGIKGYPQINLSNFTIFNFKNIFLPYGVIMFSLWGLTVVPEVRDIMQGSEKKLKSILAGGIILSALTYIIFIFIVLGISGANTTSDALLGLGKFLPNNILALALFFGVVTTFTSFLTLGLTLKKIFYYDYKKSMPFSLIFSCGIPFLLFLLGFNKFIEIIALVGAVGLGIDGTFVLLMHQRAKKMGTRKKPEYDIKIPPIVNYILSGLLVLGVVLEIVFSLVKV